MKTLNHALLLAGAAACALAPTFALAQKADLQVPLAIKDVRHALTRTSFGASPSDLQVFVGKSRSDLVRAILDDMNADNRHPLPSFTTEWRVPTEMLYAKSETLGDLSVGQQYINLGELSAWWMVEMMQSDSPFKEQMTLFWMDHFVTSFEAHEDSLLSFEKFQTIRETMNGSFRDMLAAQLKSPSMLLYLNNVENTAEAPNENLGREVFELFTLGQGRGYTEADIREISRALTGASVDGEGNYLFVAQDHDAGPKKIFGQKGKFGPDDLPDLILAQDAFGPYIVERLWQHLISDTPHPDQVADITAQWKASDWDLPTLYRAVLESQGFWDKANQGKLVKSPIDLFVGFNRTFGTAPPAVLDLYWSIVDAGQEPFLPPNVAGWDDGVAWITDSSLAFRTAQLKQLSDTWASETFEVYEATEPAETATFTETQGFRLGTAALDWAWAENDEGWEEVGASITLFDLGFKGKTYEGFTFYFGQGTDGDYSEAYFGIDDESCGAGCPLRSALDRVTPAEAGEMRELWMTTEEMSEGFKGFNDEEAAFASALIKALPALVKDVEHDQTWSYLTEESAMEDLLVPSFADIEDAAKLVNKTFGKVGPLADGFQSSAELERGESKPGRLGIPQELLALASAGKSLDDESDADVDEVYDSLIDARAAIHQARLRESYAGPDQWFNALPDLAKTAAGLEIALLPVRNPSLATDDRAVEGLEDLLFALILDPRFHLK